MEFRILGPLEVLEGDRRLALGGSRQRALLAVLLLHANETLSTDALLDELWSQRPPATAAKTVQVHVSRLRKALAVDGRTGPIVTRDHGYRLEANPEQIDARRFERLVAEARGDLDAGEPRRAAATLEEARALWHGPPLADLAYEPFAQSETARLADLRVAATELHVEARLALGAHAEVVGELEALIAEHPYRERLRGQLMLALYRSDRQAEALQAYQDARRALVDELGIEPGEHLRELERAVLAQDPALALTVEQPDAPPPPAPAAPRRPTRRLVSVLVAGIGPDDPEALHALLGRFADVVGRHGGEAEGTTGDAIVGVFGLTELHEDDALRAARAALEIRDLAPVRVGLDAGEAFVGADARRATGEPFATAGALQAAAADGEILAGTRIAELLAGSAELEAGPPVPARGAEHASSRLLRLRTEAPAPASAFVGRDEELAALRDAFRRTCHERALVAVTVTGPAGIGKSRLVREMLDDIGDDATIAIGRCLSYGEDVAYRPLAEIVRQLGGEDAAAGIAALLDGDEALTGSVLRAVGLGDGAPVQADETFWAVRRLLERVANRRPLVLAVDDVHWAEPTLLDLLDYVGSFSGAHPILVLCLGRPEFVEMRPGWFAPGSGRSVIALEPLTHGEALELVRDAPGAPGIVRRAEGNPLFLEQLVAMGADEGALPSSIQAVLAARIERLDADERDVLERASVEGVRFHVGGSHAASHLASLARKGLIRADRSRPDAFRFEHALIRDAAYLGVPKERRADLHEEAAAGAAEDETAGHHLAEACRLLRELGRDGPRERELAASASTRLESAGEATLRRGDAPAGARLLERAAALAPGRPELVPRLGAALLEAGRLADADDAMTRAIQDPGADPSLRARARVERALVRLQTGEAGEAPGVVAGEALDVLSRGRDETGRCRALYLRAVQAWIEGRAAAADDDWARAAEHAHRAGDDATLLAILSWRASAALFGPTPAPEAIVRCSGFGDQVAYSALARAQTLHPLAALHAMTGNRDEALSLMRAADEVLLDVGDLRASVGQEAAIVEVLCGIPDAAEARLRAAFEQLEAMGEKALLADTAAMLARVLYDAGRLDDADEVCAVGEQAAAGDDLSAQIGWRGGEGRGVSPRERIR
jgi:DNA-binding SARP family transcriptional activator